MPRSRPRPLIVLTTSFVGAVAAALILAACSGGGSAADRSGDQQLTGTFSGNGTDDPRVVLDALGDHLGLGVCARKNPQNADSSWTAPLISVPATLLDGNYGCGRQVAVSNGSGTTVTATVVGKCANCTGGDVALSPELFHQLAKFGQINGSISLTWRYIS